MFKLILMAIAVVAATCAPMPEPVAPGPLPPPLLASYPLIYTAPYVKVYPYQPVPFTYYNNYNNYKWLPGSAYSY